MIHTFIPFAADLNLGREFNRCMEMIGEDDWACFLDHDAMWLTRTWHAQLLEAIEAAPQAGLFTAVQSRGWQAWQRAPELDLVFDVQALRKAATERRKLRTLLDVTDSSGVAGVVLCTSKRAWRAAGGFVDGSMYCCDHAYHFALKAAGWRVYVIEGLLVFHWRRANGDRPPLDAPTAKNCPCGAIRSHEVPPTHRIALPA